MYCANDECSNFTEQSQYCDECAESHEGILVMPPALWRCVIQHCDEAARRRLFSSCKLLSEHREGWGNQAPEETIVVEVMTEQETIDAEACIHRSVYGFTRELLGLKRGDLFLIRHPSFSSLSRV